MAALALDSFCGVREALYGVFDGDKNVEVPNLLQCTMADVLAEELHKAQRQEDYMTNTFLTMQRYAAQSLSMVYSGQNSEGVALRQETGDGGSADGRFSSSLSHQTRPRGAERARRLLHPESRQCRLVSGCPVPRRQTRAAVGHADGEG